MPLNLIKKYSNLLEIQYLPYAQRNESLRKIFERDIEKNEDFKYNQKSIYPVKKDGKPTMDTLFNHLITKTSDDKKENKSRCFDIHRSQRLHWIKYHIDNSDKIKVFSYKDRVSRKDVVRTYVYDQKQKYVIILEPRTEGIDLYYLLTAYYLDEKYGEKMINKKMKKRLHDIY